MSVVQALYSEALEGNVKAAEKLQDLIGETVGRERLAFDKANQCTNGGYKQ